MSALARRLVTLIMAAAAAWVDCNPDAARTPQPRVIVLGFDGMDYGLTKQLMDAGRMPNFQRLAAAGIFAPLGTSVPPQSPVAWSDFITGMNAGGHGIYDFVHRDPQTMLPYLSTSRAEPGKSLRLGSWRIPLSGGKVELLRHGAPFWEHLSRRGIETTIVRIPADFPPSGTATRELSGMGTPDILGTYGTFTFFTSGATARAETQVNGGRIVAVRPVNGAFQGELRGPENPYRAEPEELVCEFDFYADPERPMAKLVLGSEERLLREKEWSDWVPLEFHMAPARGLPAMCRFYVKQLRPSIELYASPVNIDPMRPALPISTPPGWADELARSTGRFYSQGIPEDTKAYADSVFSPDEFLAQAALVEAEKLRQYRDLLHRFDRGLLFYYFGSVDQVSHMMWRPMDPGHPAYDPVTDAPYASVVPEVYERMDSIVGETLASMDRTALLIVMSDHGFASWRRAFNLNGWLRDQGYLSLKNPDLAADPGMLANVDWTRTRAYGLGLNGLYVNLAGRERWGIVTPAERGALLDEIAARLLATTDPATGSPAVTRVDRTDRWDAVPGGAPPSLAVGPDLIVGYAKGTRCSDSSGLGEVRREVFTDNTGAWSGDHCWDPDAVPGILLANRALRRPVQRLQDLGAAIVAEFEDGGSGTPTAAAPKR